MKRKIYSLILALFAIKTATLSAQAYSLLHSYDWPADGGMSYVPVLIVSNRIYESGIGALSSMNLDGSDFTVLHSYDDIGAGSDGARCMSKLVRIGSKLYGTTEQGGADVWGTVFSMNLDGSDFMVIHSFNINSGTSENSPRNGLAVIGDTLYGTTLLGPGTSGGAIFSIQLAGTYSVLHTFDNALEPGQLLAAGNMLYGTASYWGQAAIVFSMDANGNFNVLHTFTNGLPEPTPALDGQESYAGLAIAGNTLYGTTQWGGVNGWGTIFSIKTDGTSYRIVHNFDSITGNASDPSEDENYPGVMAELLVNGDTIYGTTPWASNSEDGLIFSVKTDGSSFTDVHDFNLLDGSEPAAGLILSGDTLYGTTWSGGGNNYGTVYSLPLPTVTPPSLVILGLDMNNFVFESNVTYYVSNSISISGMTTIEGGAIIKYAHGTSIIVENLDCEGPSNNPTIFTSMNDDSVGVTISGSNHSPATGDYDIALEFDRDTGTTVKNISISYCDTGLRFYDTDQNYEWMTNFVQNASLQHILSGISSESGDSGNDQPFLSISNAVISDGECALDGYFWGGAADTVNISNCSLNNDWGYGYNEFYITNSRLDDSYGDDYSMTLDGDNNGFHDCGHLGSDWYYY